MKTVNSKDGTRIAYEQAGAGPPLVLVDGAFCSRAFGPMPKLAQRLAAKYTVTWYDRRGRNDSGDTAPYAPEREVEDLRAVAGAAGSTPYVYGTSSGAALVMRAAAAGLDARKLVLFEPPYRSSEPPAPPDYRAQIDRALAANRRGDAVKLFMRAVDVPAFGIFMMQWIPGVWSNMTAAAHTLPYDFAVLGDVPGQPLPAAVTERLGTIRTPTLLALGGKSPPWMVHAVQTVAAAIPGARLHTVPGQNHTISPKAIAPVLAEFFA